ncbi:MAG: acyl carrier protein [Lachnospiraceae bacterium]|nr:acyl carrier protein [Lachnospiraceae bacterium]
MSVSEIRQMIIEIVYKLNPTNIKITDNHKSLIDDFKFDSLMLIDFTLEIEDKFDILFEVDDDLNLLFNDINILAEFIFSRRMING